MSSFGFNRLSWMYALFAYICCLSLTYGEITITTNVGRISGFIENVHVDGRSLKITKFMGIPFAESTSGQNRFLKPVPKAPFTETYNASRKPIGCIQSSKEATERLSKFMNFSEDCLLLNIYVPHTFIFNTSLPVMVWIYGGAFVEGASGIYPGDLLNAYTNVIVVTINYRIGMFGFLQSVDGRIPGNQGLWDQHLALKWVHENIAAFTGDPSKVTIFGQSAGGASVLYQSLFPGNKGYFQRVIAESGSPLALWASIVGPNAEEFITRMNCDKAADPVACLRMKSPNQLQIPRSVTDKLQFAPSVDGDFLPESPEDILFGNNSKSSAAREFYSSLNILSGVNNLDGALYMVAVWPPILGYTDINSPKITPDQFNNIVVPATVDRVLYPKDNNTGDLLDSVVIFEYTNWEDPTSFTSTRQSTLTLSNDIAFFSPAIRAAQAHAALQNAKSFFYEFGVRVDQHDLPTPNWVNGSTHGDEVKYVLCKPLDDNMGNNHTEDDKLVARAVATMWSNFAKSGNPNGPEDITKYIHTTWPEYMTSSQQYLEITSHMTYPIKDRFHAKRMVFWTEWIPT